MRRQSNVKIIYGFALPLKQAGAYHQVQNIAAPTIFDQFTHVPQARIFFRGGLAPRRGKTVCF
jgi:hypothetical protein